MFVVDQRGSSARYGILAAGGLAASIALSGQASAQPEAARHATLEEVVVTAQKREENIQQTPLAISAFGNQALEDIGAVDVADLGDRVPNVLLLPTPASNITMSASVRGISSSEPSLAQDAKVGMYIDGVYLGKNTGAIFDIADLERIEVLRGPQGTLYGKNTTAGAINIVTAKPKGVFGFKESFTYGNNGRMRSQTTVDTPRVADVAAKFTYMTRTFDGVAKNVNPRGPKELGRDDTSGYRLALNWAPTDYFTADYAFDRTYGVGVAKPAQLSWVNPAYANLPIITSPTLTSLPLVQVGSNYMLMPGPNHPFQQMLDSGKVEPGHKRQDVFDLDGINEEHYDIRGHALTLAWSWDNVEFKSITGYRELSVRLLPGGTDNDGGAWSLPVFHNATVRNGGNRKSAEQFSQEFQLIGDALDERLEYVVGAYYYEDEGKEFNSNWSSLLPVTQVVNGVPRVVSLIDGRLIPPPQGQGESYSVDNRSYAVFGQGTYTPDFLDSRLRFTLGLRQTWDDKKAAILDANPHYKADASWKNFNPSFTVDFQLTPDINAYAKIATGYTAGSHPIRSSTQAAFNLTADPEEVVDYEVGVKSDWWDRRLRVNAAAFYYDYTDLQITDFQAGSTVVTNAGKAVLRGFELEVTAIPVEGLTVDLAYGYLDFDYKEYLATITPPGGGAPFEQDVSDTARASHTPPHTGRLNVQYEFAPFSFGILTAAVEATYSDEYHFNPREYLHDAADQRTLLNARIGLSALPVPQGDLRIALWGRNLEDKEYREYGIDFGALGFANNTYGDPRSYGIDVIYEY